MSDISYVTLEGLNRLKKELDQMKRVDRTSISQQIADARDKGDLSENAEYDAAKEAQGLLEMRISKLENVVANSRILDESKIDTETVQILNKVKLKNLTNNMVMEYTIVSASEANIKEKKLSVNTPIAKGLLGKRVGDIAEVLVPSGLQSFEIIKISI